MFSSLLLPEEQPVGESDHGEAARAEVVRQRLRDELGLPDDAVLCLSTARLTRASGYLAQVVAAKHLMSRSGGERLYFAWIGTGEQRAELAAAIALARLGSRIHLLGAREDEADWFSAADIFVWPEGDEERPQAVMMAMASGLPVVVANRLGGMVGTAGTRLPAAADDCVGLVTQLIRTLHGWVNDDQRRRNAGAAARAWARAGLPAERPLRSPSGRGMGAGAEKIPVVADVFTPLV